MTNDELNGACVDALSEGMAEALDKCLPPTHGFILLVVDGRKGGAVNYLSNITDACVIKLMQDFIARRAQTDKECS